MWTGTDRFAADVPPNPTQMRKAIMTSGRDPATATHEEMDDVRFICIMCKESLVQGCIALSCWQTVRASTRARLCVADVSSSF